MQMNDSFFKVIILTPPANCRAAYPTNISLPKRGSGTSIKCIQAVTDQRHWRAWHHARETSLPRHVDS